MKVTKYEHACLVVEEKGSCVVIDPGIYAKTLPALTNVTAVVITHTHPDHFDANLVKNIVAANPKVTILGPAEVTGQIGELLTITVGAGENHNIGDFVLKFYGGQHAFVYGNVPATQNVGVLINNMFYYPGDSFTKPDILPKLLALPIGGPWLKTAEAIGFATELKPARVFPTHNIHLSNEGNSSNNTWLEGVAKGQGFEYTVLQTGESLEY